jgi:diguanylate cyclase (GGDEF)-like protein
LEDDGFLKDAGVVPIIAVKTTRTQRGGGQMASERILFVDDDPVSRRAFARAMRKSGFIVDLAQNGDEAWELATHFPYAVIATDLRMPGMDGMMLIDQLKELQPDPVCLLVTGCKQLEWYKESGEPNIDVIQKPWNGDQLAEALRQALREYRSRATTIYPPSERPDDEISREVVVIGLEASARDTVRQALGKSYQALYANTVEEAAALLTGHAAVCCCLLEDAPHNAVDIRRLGRANARVPIVLLGKDRNERAAVEAIRKGAQDWLPLGSLNPVDLGRVIATARERSRAPGGPLPVCTELSNPSLLFDRFRQAISRARRYSRQAGVLLVDVDRFGDINSALGYDAGDELLALVAERLRVSVRESDAVFRLRQDEFALVLEDVAQADTIHVPAQRVLNSFATPFRSGGHEIVLTASIGGAVFPTHGQSAQELMRRAESALEQAKREGRNRFCTQNESGAAGEGGVVVGPQDGASHLN